MKRVIYYIVIWSEEGEIKGTASFTSKGSASAFGMSKETEGYEVDYDVEEDYECD